MCACVARGENDSNPQKRINYEFRNGVALKLIDLVGTLIRQQKERESGEIDAFDNMCLGA